MKKVIAIGAILMIMVTLGCAGSSSTQQTASSGSRTGVASDQDLSAIGGNNAAVGSAVGSKRTNSELYKIVGTYRMP